MNKDEAIALCGKWLPAWTGNHPDKLMEFYSEDAFYLDPANKEGLRGVGQILPYFRKLLAANPNWKWEAVEIFPTDSGFIGKWRATIPVGTEVILEQGLDIVEVGNGKVTRNEVYFDRSRLLEAFRRKPRGETNKSGKSEERLTPVHGKRSAPNKAGRPRR